jgi:hypothetical protein
MIREIMARYGGKGLWRGKEVKAGENFPVFSGLP